MAIIWYQNFVTTFLYEIDFLMTVPYPGREYVAIIR